MVKVNDAYQQGRFERIWFYCSLVMLSNQVFTTQAGRTDEHD